MDAAAEAIAEEVAVTIGFFDFFTARHVSALQRGKLGVCALLWCKFEPCRNNPGSFSLFATRLDSRSARDISQNKIQYLVWYTQSFISYFTAGFRFWHSSSLRDYEY